MENQIKRKLVCTGWLLDISTSTTNARKKLLIDFRGKICSGKGGCKCGNCRVRQPQALRVTTFPMQITRQKTMRLEWSDGEHQDVILGQRHRSILDLFFSHFFAFTDYSATRKRQISKGRAMRRKRRAETRLVNWITVTIVTYHYDYNIVPPQ